MRDLTRLRNKVQSSVQRLFNSPLPDIQVYSSQEAATAAVAAGPAQSHAHHQDGRYWYSSVYYCTTQGSAVLLHLVCTLLGACTCM